MSAPTSVIVCGGGVIGAAVAWFLAKAGARPTVIEGTAVACGASGKSGGFLALDWCDGSPLEPLARRSFALHAELARALPDRWGYRPLTTYHLHHDAHRTAASWHPSDLPAWFDPATVAVQRLGTPETTAALLPEAFTRSLIDAAIETGGRLVVARVTGLVQSGDGRVTGVIADGETISADAVVIATGPWSNATASLDLPRVHALEGTSLVFRLHDGPSEPMACFVDVLGADGSHDSPEIVVRSNGTVYVSGLAGQPLLPDDPARVTPEPATVDRLLAMVQAFAPGLARSPVIARQACFRPVLRDGLPLIGPIPDAPGAFIATGHSVWGMLNAPATGELVTDLVLGRSPGIDPGPFAVDRPGLN